MRFKERLSRGQFSCRLLFFKDIQYMDEPTHDVLLAERYNNSNSGVNVLSGDTIAAGRRT